MAAIVALSAAPGLATAAPPYVIKIYPAVAQPEARAAVGTLAKDLTQQVRTIKPMISTSNAVVRPTVIYDLTIAPSDGGQPAGDSDRMAQTQTLIGAVGLIQQRNYDIADLSSDFSFKDSSAALSPVGLTANFASLFTPTTGSGHSLATVSSMKLHSVVIFYIAAREAYKRGLFPESMYYVELAQGLVGRTRPPPLQAVMTDLDKLKAQLRARGRGGGGQ